jgi:hypothetical protein
LARFDDLAPAIGEPARIHRGQLKIKFSSFMKLTRRQPNPIDFKSAGGRVPQQRVARRLPAIYEWREFNCPAPAESVRVRGAEKQGFDALVIKCPIR